MGEMDLVRKYQCDECGMLSDRSMATEIKVIQLDCPVCKEATIHRAVAVNDIERQLKEQACACG